MDLDVDSLFDALTGFLQTAQGNESSLRLGDRIGRLELLKLCHSRLPSCYLGAEIFDVARAWGIGQKLILVRDLLRRHFVQFPEDWAPGM